MAQLERQGSLVHLQSFQGRESMYSLIESVNRVIIVVDNGGEELLQFFLEFGDLGYDHRIGIKDTGLGHGRRKYQRKWWKGLTFCRKVSWPRRCEVDSALFHSHSVVWFLFSFFKNKIISLLDLACFFSLFNKTKDYASSVSNFMKLFDFFIKIILSIL